jgi:hypothetical protein
MAISWPTLRSPCAAIIPNSARCARNGKRPFCDGHHIFKVKPAICHDRRDEISRESAMPCSSSLEAPAVRRGDFSAWRRFFATVFAGPKRKAEDEITEYLERHQHDLPPALRIELERRSMSP